MPLRIIAALAALLCFLSDSALAQQVAPTEPSRLPKSKSSSICHPALRYNLSPLSRLSISRLNLSLTLRVGCGSRITIEYPFPATDPEAARDTVKVLVDRNGMARPMR